MKFILLIFATVIFFSCGSNEKTEPMKKSSEIKDVVFTDVTTESGIDFVHYNGAFGKKYFPETNGAGGGWLDYNGDGWQDVLLIQGSSWPSNPGEKPTLKLYRNNGNGTFVDATIDAGLDVSVYGMGMAAADYDNDGDTDVFITCVGENLFFRNDKGRFTEVGLEAGLADPAWGASAMFFDYDKDGWLDLFVCNYVKWSEETDLECSLDGKNKGYCTPEIYEGEPSKLYRNLGDGTFEDVTASAGVYSDEGKALGVAMLDFNSDGWLDIAVANDTQPDFLFENLGRGEDGVVRFKEVGLFSGFALDEGGKARAGMGIDVGMVDTSGEETIFVGNFSNEMIGVYRDLGNGSFVDRAAVSQIGNPSLLYLTFGLLLFDYDLDFDLDLLGVNGHVQPGIESIQQAVRYKQSALLFNNNGEGRFTNVSDRAGEALTNSVVGRGVAYADYDRDGDQDILLTVNNGPAVLLGNDLIRGKILTNVLRVRLEGTTVNKDGIGAVVRATVDGRRMDQMVKTGSSYLSQSELTITIATPNGKIDALEVAWPNGDFEEINDAEPGMEILIKQGSGISTKQRFSKSDSTSVSH